jgi:hypothetical protein
VQEDHNLPKERSAVRELAKELLLLHVSRLTTPMENFKVGQLHPDIAIIQEQQKTMVVYM